MDCHAMTRALWKTSNCQTFGESAVVFRKAVLKQRRVDAVFDMNIVHYMTIFENDNSIKEKIPMRKIMHSPDVTLPYVWDQFISLEANKDNLANFLSTKLHRQASNLPEETDAVIGGGNPDPEGT